MKRILAAGLLVLAGATGPDDRALTNPHSVTSASNPAARPASIDDLYYTRSVFGPAWAAGSPIQLTQSVVDILRAEGRVVDVHYYPDEGHGFAKRENQIDSIRRTIDWFEKYLKGGSSAATEQRTQHQP